MKKEYINPFLCERRLISQIEFATGISNGNETVLDGNAGWEGLTPED